MKQIFCLVSLLVLCPRLFSQTVHELTDKKDIIFARNLTDYQGNPVQSLAFDIYYPTGATSDKKYPVYFSFHGGSFTSATKQSVTEFSDELAELGFVVIAPDYRVGYYNSSTACDASYDSTALQGAIYRAIQDVNACIRFVANHAGDYNIDSSQIFTGGASAGGTLAMNAAYVTDSVAAVHYPDLVTQWGGVQTSGNSEPYKYTIKGISAMWAGLPYWDGLINSKSAVPAILFKGGRDTNLPDGVGYYLQCPYSTRVRAGKGIYADMTTAKVACVYHYQPNSAHTAYDNIFCTKNTACFFKSIINKSAYSGYYEYYNASCR